MSGLSSVNSVSSFGDVSVDVDLQSTFTRSYPSIKDYYNANTVSPNKPIQLQPGLSNYSSLIFGDDRIGFSESVMNVTYKGAVEDRMKIPSPSKAKSVQVRRKDYDEAFERVGNTELDRLERQMKDKLQQRSAKTSSHFQINKAFKFFDREQCGCIHIEGFTRALEFLGFQFSDSQNLALFARYDVDCIGEIDYTYFIQTAMFEVEAHPRSHSPNSRQMTGYGLHSSELVPFEVAPLFAGVGENEDFDVMQVILSYSVSFSLFQL